MAVNSKKSVPCKLLPGSLKKRTRHLNGGTWIPEKALHENGVEDPDADVQRALLTPRNPLYAAFVDFKDAFIRRPGTKLCPL